MLDLLCPVCGGRLVRKEKAWRCENHHCFDVARSGYVNLLPPSASGKRHGDDKRMVAARTAFLSRGYYDHLIGAVAVACAQAAGPDACVLDAGCGEGTYTRAIYDALAAKGGCPQLLGADISAEAVRRAARQVPEGIFCAASTAHLPLAAESLDLIVNIFSPLMAEEFLRVLKPGGRLLAGLDNGFNYAFDEDETKIINTLPFNPLEDEGQMRQLQKDDSGIQFSHTAHEQLTGQLKAGLQLLDLYEDTNGYGNLHAHNIPTYWATLARKA